MSLFTATALSSDPAWKFVVRVTGIVQCQKGGQTAWVSIWNGRMLSDGDKAKTMKDSRAKILLPDNSFFIIGANTTLEMSKVEYSKTGRFVQLKLDVGKVRIKVQKFAGKDSRFEVVTPRAVLAARGTEVFIQQDPPGPSGDAGATRWVVFESRLDVTGTTSQGSFFPGQSGMIDTNNNMRNDAGFQGTSGGPAGGQSSGGSSAERTGETGTGESGTGETSGTGTGETSGGTIGGSGGASSPVDADLNSPGTSYGGGNVIPDGSTRGAAGGSGSDSTRSSSGTDSNRTGSAGDSMTGATTGGAAGSSGTSTPPYVPATNTTKGSLQIVIR
jgi:hypothetical protein